MTSTFKEEAEQILQTMLDHVGIGHASPEQKSEAIAKLIHLHNVAVVEAVQETVNELANLVYDRHIAELQTPKEVTK